VTAVTCFDCDSGFVDERGLLDRLYRNKSSGSALILELHDTGNLCEQCIVFADSNIQAGLEFGASLTNQNRSTCDELARKTLHAKPLGMAVAAVA
jgi:hypothetical protein